MNSELKLMPREVEMRKFKKFFHGSLDTNFQLFSKKKNNTNKCTNFSSKFTSLTKDQLVDGNLDGMEVAMMINASDGGGRSKKNVTGINAVFVDCDNGACTIEKLQALPVPAHAIVETSSGNFHAYWLVKDCSIPQFKSIQQALAKLLETDPSICDASRVMRMPGTYNWKRKPAFLARIVTMVDTPKRIPIDRFIKKMKLDVGPAEQRTALIVDRASDPQIVRQGLTPSIQAKIVEALDGLSADERWLWQRIGMAIHSLDNTDAGYDLWEKWSRKSAKFDERDQRKRWNEFQTGGGININTLFWHVNQFKTTGSSSFDEMSLAKLFAETFNQSLRYDRENRIWFYFKDVVWKSDAQAPIRLARSFIEELSQGENGPPSDSLKRFRSVAAFKCIVNQVELLDVMRIDAQTFDKNPNLLAVKNGVIDLSTGVFRVALASDYLRRQANVAFNAGEKYPEWFNFMKSVTCKDRDLYSFIRRALGYTLFGHANLQCFMMAIGSGSNGKGVLMRTVQKILGDYAQSVAPNLLTSAYSGNVNGPTPALARLLGARMVVCTELPTGRKLDDAFIKQYAGGDELTARATYGDVFSFKPEGKLWLSTNEIPDISASDDAMWRRLKPIPFRAKFQGDKVDPKLEEKLDKEHSGILNWLLKGAKQFESTGLGTCTAVEKMQEQLRKDADSVLAWISECCITKADEETQSSMAHESYVNFTRRSRRKPLGSVAFRANLEDKGFHHRRKKRCNVFTGFYLQT